MLAPVPRNRQQPQPRMDGDVPLLIPEVNWEHATALAWQQRRGGYGSGFIVTNPNCSTGGLVLALKPLQVVTMQAIPGAGPDGV